MTPTPMPTAEALPSGMPADLDEAAPARLQAGALVAGAALAFAALSEPFRPASAGSGWVSPVAAFVGVVLALAVALAARRVAPDRLPGLGFALMVGLGVVIWVMELAAPFAATTHTPGVPMAAAWLLVFPMLVSLPLRRALAGVLLVSLSGPVVLWAYVQAGQPTPDLTHAALWFVVAGVAGLLSLGTSSVLGRAASEVRAAREASRYVLGEVLGRGGMGEVRAAWHRRLASPVAVKRIRPDLGGAPLQWSFAERFVLEAQVTARLSSPHTVALYDFGETEDGALFYVMELIDGVDLHEVVRWGGPLAPSRVVRLLVQALDALIEAHEAGLVHRDIKPSNMMISPRGTEGEVLKVLDFGTVKVGDLPEHGLGVGTPAFAAPESLRGEAVAASDIYGLGCVAWWLLVGDTVYDAESAERQRAAHAAGALPDLDAEAPWPVPAALADAVRACLALAPEDRPTARQLADALGKIPTADWSASDARQWWREARA